MSAAKESDVTQVGDEVSEVDNSYDGLAEPPHVDVPVDNPLWPAVLAAIKEVYDPEIPVNVYELGLIYTITMVARDDGAQDVDVKMTLTTPACPVAQEMPTWIQGAILGVEGVGDVDVDVIWDPVWDPSMMAETAKMQLNMFV